MTERVVLAYSGGLDTSVAIPYLAEQTGADLVVVGSHRPTMATYLLGSNASTIVRHAKCSVLVVRA